MATSIIGAIQERYAAQTWAGKPPDLWFSATWPKRQNGTLVSYPLLTFTHEGTPHGMQFNPQVLQYWRFKFTAYADSPQGIEAIYNGFMFDGQDPMSGLGFGFWRPRTMTVPTGYVFKSLVPTTEFRTEVRDGQFAASGASITVGTWGIELFVHRTAF